MLNKQQQQYFLSILHNNTTLECVFLHNTQSKKNKKNLRDARRGWDIDISENVFIFLNFSWIISEMLLLN